MHRRAAMAAEKPNIVIAPPVHKIIEARLEQVFEDGTADWPA